MNRRRVLLSVTAAMGIVLSSIGAGAQQKSLKDQLVGTWSLASWEQTYKDGTKDKAFGETPKGIHTFSPDGRFAVIFLRPDLPKIAANDRIKPTPEEATAIAKGVIAYYGTYTVSEADKSIDMNFEATSFTNQLAQQPQKRIVTAITADELKYRNPSSTSGGQIEITLKRAK
jgi:hypothetical protein